jgi:hypothetical protein
MLSFFFLLVIGLEEFLVIIVGYWGTYMTIYFEHLKEF